MKRFFFLAVLATLFACVPVQAQQNADERYVVVYGLIQQGDNLLAAGESARALDSYNQAQAELQSFNKAFPNWNPNIINFRLSYVASKIEDLSATLAPTNAVPVAAVAPATGATPAAPASPANADVSTTNTAMATVNASLQAQVQALQQQLQNVQANNATLEAKLKEALTIQPAAVDARELEKTRDQVRELMKQNDLLQATLNQRNQPAVQSAADAATLANVQTELATAKDHLREESMRSDRLALENQMLNSRVKQLLGTPEATAALAQENALLKKELADVKAATAAAPVPATVPGPPPAAAPAIVTPDNSVELSKAQATITILQSNVTVTALERDALLQKVKQLQATNATGLAADKQADYEARIKSLTDERNDLLAKLGIANQAIYGHKKQDVAAKMGQLSDEIATLRARLAVDESQVVPYSDEELALFKQPVPKLADPDAQKKSVKELPPGSAGLVMEAQHYFAAKKYDEAAVDYLKILEHDQNNSLVLGNLATIELQQNKLDDAEKHIRSALAQNPNDPYNVGVLGYIQFQQGKYDDAMGTLSLAAKLDPQNPQILNFLAGCYNHKGLRQQAETTLRRAIQLDPANAEAHNNLAAIYLSQNPPLIQLARWHYQKALDGGQPHNLNLEKELAEKGAPVN